MYVCMYVCRRVSRTSDTLSVVLACFLVLHSTSPLVLRYTVTGKT